MKTIGQDNMLQKINSLVLCLALSFLFSCSSEENPSFYINDGNTAVENSCRAIMNVHTGKYSDDCTTRAISDEWADEATIYLRMEGNGVKCDGKVVYDKSEDSWTLYYEGILPTGDYSGTAFYIKGVPNTSNNVLNFTAESPVYVDTEITCQRKPEGVWITMTLHPQTGRIRFSGIANKTIRISGVWNYSTFDVANKRLSESQSPIALQIGASGYTPYCYCSFPQESRTLSVAYDNYQFTTVCEHPILDAAQAGYMELPTAEYHNGWEMTEISLPSVSEVSVSGIGTHQATLSSSIVNNGNATVSECGFCYSTAINPTIDDVRVSCGTPMGNGFIKSITGLRDNTTYHVRSYAINELGIAYSQDIEFTTIAITLPILSTVTVNGKEGVGSADFSSVITSDGNGNIVECGFVYSTHEMPTISDSKVISSSNPNLSSSVNNLTVGMRYYVRAFATNEKGTAYGQQVSFIAGGGKPGDDDIDRPIL